MSQIARQLLARYPRLRSTWPVQRARAWRQHQSWQAHPRRMASWYRDMPDMRTRLIISNLELPEAPQVCGPTALVISLLDQDGALLTRKRVRLARNASVVMELGAL